MGTSEYARPELLAEPDWAWEHRGETSARIVDCGLGAAYWRAHVPGAILLPIDPWLKDSADGRYVIGPDTVAEVMSTLGVEEGEDGRLPPGKNRLRSERSSSLAQTRS